MVNLPDSIIIETTIKTTIIDGCTDGTYKDLTTMETIYSYNTEDSIVMVIDSTVIGSRGWLGDGECDSEGYLFENYGLDFNCIEHDYEGGDCYSLERVNSHVKNKSRSKSYYKLSKKKNKLKLNKLINQKN